ncbi:MAG: undecaprenyldiphospho-muramoylpentapeptide beta-N-acetylglucosaminyltransferase [Erysipelotrichaceae bacterium]|nr:undecaprenyldiphospho-muramoylpentapeptide beta-N-acetylglucosaminyltransferase [Erysipelotrichaceae bacterium]
MKVLIATGGTGGHIYPAISLADYLAKNYKNMSFMFVGNSDRMESTIIPELGYRFLGITAAKFNGANNKLGALKTLYRSYKECIRVVESFQPDIIVGFGGYVTVPVIMAGVHCGVKTVIHEQNSFAGMANKALSHFVSKVITVYPNVAESFPKRKVVNLGNPRESAVLDLTVDKRTLEQFGFDISKKTLLIVMGSLGSVTVNQKMTEILSRMKEKNYNVIYVTGKNNYDDMIRKVSESENVRIVPYIDQFRVASACDLIISRGGATSACEYMALGLPSIIVPSPYVTNNHQYYNAKSMVDNGASFLIEEKDLDADVLLDKVDELLGDDMKLQNMSKAARAMSHPYAARDISELLFKVAGIEHE